MSELLASSWVGLDPVYCRCLRETCADAATGGSEFKKKQDIGEFVYQPRDIAGG